MSVETLLARLPSLDARLRRAEVEAIAATLGHDLVSTLLKALQECEKHARAIEKDTEETIDAWQKAPDRALIVGWLKRQGQWGRSERWAVRRRLGIGVVRERAQIAVEQCGIREEILLKLLRGQISVDQPAPQEVVDCLLQSRRWQSRKAAAEVLLSHAQAGGPQGGCWPAVLARSQDVGEHPWVCDACDAWLGVTHPEQARTLLVDGLQPVSTRHHFLLRRLRMERFIRQFPEYAARIFPVLLADPSEHVRIGMAQALCEYQSVETRDLLVSLGRQPAPRVRLAVAEYLGRYAARQEPGWLTGFLTERLEQEDESSVLRTLARTAARTVDAWPEQGARLALALERAILRDISGESAEAAAVARERCTRSVIATTLVERISKHVKEIQIGTSVFFSWPTLGLEKAPPTAELGEAMAVVAREDFGLWARPAEKGVWLRRGDRFRFRLWRALHELRNPAPNKRQGWDHTVGRSFSEPVRAPSARMAEVTATTVPGERVVIDREGSWVPMLPTVDDLLDMGSGAELYSAYGVTRIRPAPRIHARIFNRLKLTFSYAKLARLRSQSLAAREPAERSAYLREIQRDLGVTVEFSPYSPPPARIAELTGSFGLLGGLDSLLAPTRSSQAALAAFTSGLLALMLVDAWYQREQIRQARAEIPLVIGGWGTRGKSGTERIKAAIFHGLGHPVFVKTTGCEAMFIQAYPGLSAREVFIFRPHDKSSIWEQANMLRQAAGMRARVMLWECMALRTNYVETLEQDWMRDDLVTLTNAFPDHEDVQGPAGHNIASTISAFIPNGARAFTTEVEFLPVLQDKARQRKTELTAVEPIEAELWGSDLLALFPYQEHPRNIALVARLAEELGIDRHLAVMLMANHVVPDLGVLRIYPEVPVYGRQLRFINGMSANERTGCVTNWRRTGCDRIHVDVDWDQSIVVVVNNRADRVARSEVFARIIVQDLAADRFVLIGTNLTGLHGCILTALDALLTNFQLYPENMTQDQVLERMADVLARLRVGQPSILNALQLAQSAIAGAGYAVVHSDSLEKELVRWLSPGQARPLSLKSILDGLYQDTALRAAFQSLVGVQRAEPIFDVVGLPSLEDAWRGWVEKVARMSVHAHLRREVETGKVKDSVFCELYREIFLASLYPIEDPSTSGDKIIATVAQQAIPGSKVTVMGVQNIKGTGLDFAYRWVALGQVASLVERWENANAQERLAALRGLLAFDDYGMVDSALVGHRLSRPSYAENQEEQALRERVMAHTTTIHTQRKNRLTSVAAQAWWQPLVGMVEKLLDPVHALWRYWVAHRTLRELTHHTISLADAAQMMQELYAMQKGGWLMKLFR